MLQRRVLLRLWALMISLVVASALYADDAGELTRTWAFSEFAEPLYADAPAALPYANPDAPKGGRIVIGDFGAFDTLNYHVAKGDWPSSISLLYDSLMSGTADEIDAYYGELAEWVEYPADKSWALFKLREEARYHDGSPVTAEDFVYSLDAKKEHGRAMIKTAYEAVERAEAVDKHHVKFYFSTRDSLKPITVVASLSPLPVKFWKDRDITASTLEPPLTSGPYRIKKMEPGRFIVYERVKDYWGKDLPMRQGIFNFDEIQYDYYRDETVMFEAFKAGKIDIRPESSAKRWVSEYDFPAVRDGRVITEEIPSKRPRGLFGYFFNLRRDKFQDIHVRKALVWLYDFEAVQRTVLFGKFSRAQHYFQGAGYESSGVPEGEELKVLERFRDQLPAELFTQPFQLPVSDGSGRDRKIKRQALRLFKQAGWQLKSGKLVNAQGEQFALEIIAGWPEAERFTAPYIANLKSVGIDARFRVVDSAQWRARSRDGDFDLITAAKTFIVPPGGELKSYYHSSSVGASGGNTGGVQDPVVDALIEQMIEARDSTAHYATMHALDRVLLAGHYAVPLYYRSDAWVAYWDVFGRPERSPTYEVGFRSTWWFDPAKSR
ncbi:MAG TPA: ABC transporter substrate-binding protein [Gammaproteobacteria bacterium]|jgi:microcin C transport system substrate-binding protein|nr:ABC transporter substrate-binding protein [Gammaproteobacteria bacterium]